MKKEQTLRIKARLYDYYNHFPGKQYGRHIHVWIKELWGENALTNAKNDIKLFMKMKSGIKGVIRKINHGGELLKILFDRNTHNYFSLKTAEEGKEFKDWTHKWASSLEKKGMEILVLSQELDPIGAKKLQLEKEMYPGLHETNGGR